MNPTRTTAIPRSGNNFYDILPLPPAFSVFSSLLPVCSIDLGMGDDVAVHLGLSTQQYHILITWTSFESLHQLLSTAKAYIIFMHTNSQRRDTLKRKFFNQD